MGKPQGLQAFISNLFYYTSNHLYSSKLSFHKHAEYLVGPVSLSFWKFINIIHYFWFIYIGYYDLLLNHEEIKYGGITSIVHGSFCLKHSFCINVNKTLNVSAGFGHTLFWIVPVDIFDNPHLIAECRLVEPFGWCEDTRIEMVWHPSL